MKKKTLSNFALGLGLGALAILSLSYAIKQGKLHMGANETPDTRSFVVEAEDIGAQLEGDEGTFYGQGLQFKISGASYSNSLISVSSGSLYNLDLAGEEANEQGRIGKGFKKVEFACLSFTSSLTVAFMDGNTSLESISLQEGESAAEIGVSGKANRVKINFSSASFSSLTFFYACGYAS